MAQSKWILTNSTVSQSVDGYIQGIVNNGHASSYAIWYTASNGGSISNFGSSSSNTHNFSSSTATQSGTISGTYTRGTSINKSAIFSLSGIVNWTGGGKSNVPSDSVEFRQPFDNNSVTGISLSPTSIWSDAAQTNITLSTTVSSTIIPYSTDHTVTSDHTATSAGVGSIASLNAATATTQTLTWVPNSSKDVGATLGGIKISIASTTTSASAAASLTSTSSLGIKNAVTALTVTDTSITLYQGGTVTITPTITPARPYDSTIVPIIKDSSGNAISPITGTACSGGNGTITVANISASSGTELVYANSIQNAQTNGVTSTGKYTFTFAKQTAVTGKNVQEGNSSTIACGINNISSYTITTGSGAIASVTYSGGSITVIGNAVDTDTDYTITVTDIYGSTNTISGTITNIATKTATINPGDKVDVAMGTGAVNTCVSSDTGVCTVAKSSTTGSVTITAVAAGSATVTVTGTNGSKNTCTVTVTNVELQLS